MNCNILTESVVGLPSQTFIHAVNHVQISRLFQERILPRSSLTPPTSRVMVIQENCLSSIHRSIVLLVNKFLVKTKSPFFVSVITHSILNTLFALDYRNVVRDILLL